MFVLSAEGGRYIDQSALATHKILGVYDRKEDALKDPRITAAENGEIILLTDTETNEVAWLCYSPARSSRHGWLSRDQN